MLSIGHASPVHAPVRSSLPWLLACGALTGALDLLFAIGWWAPLGASPVRILQSIASWFIGREAYAGGAAAASLGVVLQLLIMARSPASITCHQRLPLLSRNRCAGVRCTALRVRNAAHAVDSAAGGSGPHPPSFNLWTLALLRRLRPLVGIPCALFAREYARRD